MSRPVNNNCKQGKYSTLPATLAERNTADNLTSEVKLYFEKFIKKTCITKKSITFAMFYDQENIFTKDGSFFNKRTGYCSSLLPSMYVSSLGRDKGAVTFLLHNNLISSTL